MHIKYVSLSEIEAGLIQGIISKCFIDKNIRSLVEIEAGLTLGILAPCLMY